MKNQLRDYSKYPVYTEEEIQEEFKKAQEFTHERNSTEEEIKTLKESRNLEAKDIMKSNPELYERFFTYWVKAANAYRYACALVEANFAAINSIKTIQEAYAYTEKIMWDNFDNEEKEIKRKFNNFKERVLKIKNKSVRKG